MQTKTILCIAVLALGVSVPVVRADCPYDHLLVGQDEGTLFLNTSQLYRHGKADWSASPDPYGQQYYEFTEMYGGGYIRVEPGFSQNNDPTYALNGARGVDYNILLERVYATPGLELFDDLMTSILVSDGALFVLSDCANHHVHMRYYLRDGSDPTLPYAVSYRLKDETGTYADSEVYTVNLGAVPESDWGACHVDRFEVIGNLAGTAVDEFDDGVLNPWSLADQEATVIESGGWLTLSQPGEPGVGVLLAPGGVEIVEEFCFVETSANPGGAFPVVDGGGDFTATSRWGSTTPATNMICNMNLDCDSGDGQNDISLGIANFEPAVAEAFGVPSGLAVIMMQDSGESASRVLAAVSISESDIIDDILIRLAFDDAANEISGAFSPNGGATFQSPVGFVFSANLGAAWDKKWEVGAALFSVPHPPTAGDADLDGDVDLDDFVALKSNFGTGATWAEGDFDGDNDVDLSDFVILKNNFGVTATH